jgi:hypothetical protein
MDISQYNQIVFTWGKGKGGTRFYGVGKYFVSEQWRMVGSDKVSVVIPRTKKGKKLLRLLNTIDFSSELNPDRWLLTGRIIDTPERLLKSGCSANKVLLVDIDTTTGALKGGD